MSGFVGSRAKKRRRNIFLTLGLLIFFSLIYFIFPTIQMSTRSPVPDESIIPDPTKDLTSLASNIEELELTIFQKDQKIKFRDGQISNLQIKLKDTKFQLENTIQELKEIENAYKNITSNNANSVSVNELEILKDKFSRLNKQNDKNILKIKNLNQKIEELDDNLLLSDKSQKNISNENQKLKKDNKSLFTKNLKLNENIDNLMIKINEKNIEIEMYLKEIKKLKDRSHHGG